MKKIVYANSRNHYTILNNYQEPGLINLQRCCGFNNISNDNQIILYLFQQSGEGKITIIIVYVNDIILIGDKIIVMDRLKKSPASKFEVKDL